MILIIILGVLVAVATVFILVAVIRRSKSIVKVMYDRRRVPPRPVRPPRRDPLSPKKDCGAPCTYNDECRKECNTCDDPEGGDGTSVCYKAAPEIVFSTEIGEPPSQLPLGADATRKSCCATNYISDNKCRNCSTDDDCDKIEKCENGTCYYDDHSHSNACVPIITKADMAAGRGGFRYKPNVPLGIKMACGKEIQHKMKYEYCGKRLPEQCGCSEVQGYCRDKDSNIVGEGTFKCAMETGN